MFEKLTAAHLPPCRIESEATRARKFRADIFRTDRSARLWLSLHHDREGRVSAHFLQHHESREQKKFRADIFRPDRSIQ
jgi:hypothetical protein